MRIEDNFKDTDCYKITCVSLKPDSCKIIKGPEEERRLVEALLDDYHISRYEKMIQLVVREMIEGIFPYFLAAAFTGRISKWQKKGGIFLSPQD